MTTELRQLIRKARDAQVRAGVLGDDLPRCSGCGAELEDDFGQPLYVLGCGTCDDRRSARARRAAARPNQLSFERQAA
jgi:hypothetical protein